MPLIVWINLCADQIKDLRADDNGPWVLQRKCVAEVDEKCEVTSAVPVKKGTIHEENVFTISQ